MSLQQDLRGGGKQGAWLFLGAVGLHVHPHAGLGAPCFPAAAFPYTPAASGDLPPPPSAPISLWQLFPRLFLSQQARPQALGTRNMDAAGEKAFPSTSPGPLL